MDQVVNEKNLSRATVVVCGVLDILAFFIFIPLAVLLNSTGRSCLLYAASSGFGSEAACAYPITIATIFQLGYCTGRAVFIILVWLKVLRREWLNHKFFMLGCAITDVISCILTLVSGGIISHGFNVMCSGVFQSQSDRCGELNIYNVETSTFVESYYVQLNVAEGGVWTSWIIWLLLISIDIYFLMKTELVSIPSSFFGGIRRAGSDVRRNKGYSESETDTTDGSDAVFMTPHSRGLTAADISHTHRGWKSVPGQETNHPTPIPLPAHKSVGSDSGGGPRTPPGIRAQKKPLVPKAGASGSDGGSLPRTPPPTRPPPLPKIRK